MYQPSLRLARVKPHSRNEGMSGRATNRTERTILEGLQMLVVDRRDNPAPCDTPMAIAVRAVEIEGAAPSDPEHHPRLEGAGADGRLVVKPRVSGEYSCPILRVGEEAGTKEGQYELVFSVGALREWILGFTFSSDEKRIREMNALSEKLNELKARRRERGAERSALDSRKSKAEEAIKAIHK
jgi:hypothetical protein